MAVWSSTYVKALPDKAFLFIDKKTGERKLPVLNHLGNISLAHLRAAKARLNQTKGLTSKDKARVRKKIRALEKKALDLNSSYKYRVVRERLSADGQLRTVTVAFATTVTEAKAEARKVGGKVSHNPSYKGS